MQRVGLTERIRNLESDLRVALGRLTAAENRAAKAEEYGKAEHDRAEDLAQRVQVGGAAGG